MINWQDVPRWMRTPLVVIMLTSAILACFVIVMVTIALTRGPYHKPGPPRPQPTCGNSGVRKVLTGDAAGSYAVIVVCNNGVMITQ